MLATEHMQMPKQAVFRWEKKSNLPKKLKILKFIEEISTDHKKHQKTRKKPAQSVWQEYPPGNSHIPPGEKENHRLKSALAGRAW